MIKRISDVIFSTRASGLYMILFAVAIGVATFVENDFGTSAAQNLVFRTRWFELLLLLFCGSIVANIFRFNLIKQKKWAILTFHVSIIIILIGAGITRYFGSEGRMHIREGADANTILSNETYLHFKIKTPQNKKYSFFEPVAYSAIGQNAFKRIFLIGNQKLDIDLQEFIPNPVNELIDSERGKPVIKIVISGDEGREEYFLYDGETKWIHNTMFNFGEKGVEGAINIIYQSNDLQFISPDSISQFQMAIQKTDWLESGKIHPLMVRTLYSTPNIKFVIADFKPNGAIVTKSEKKKLDGNSNAALRFKVKINEKAGLLETYGIPGAAGQFQSINLEGFTIEASYGSREIEVPFTIRLNDFIMDRYPGTNSPASYASEVTLIDEKNNLHENHRIYMNHVLDYKGYRFFQSSFDRDELGTVLSVNHDAPGTMMSYLGYFLLTIGMLWSLVSKNSRFSDLAKKLNLLRQNSQYLKKTGMSIGLLFLLQYSLYSKTVSSVPKEISATHSAKLGKLQVQDQNGRIKPMNTLANEIMRKLARKESLYGQSAEQIILGMMVLPEEWANVPLIKTSTNAEIRKLLRSEKKILTYNDFFSPQYILQDVVMKAYNREPKDRGTFDKDLIKLDEKVNICNLVFSGQFMQWFPIPDDFNNTWAKPNDSHSDAGSSTSKECTEKFFIPYLQAVRNALENNNWSEADKALTHIQNYQIANGKNVLLAKNKLNMEILMNKLNVFSRLSIFYGLLGLALLLLFFLNVFILSKRFTGVYTVLMFLLSLCFLMHAVGLGLRWYVSGRAPWSNGYESMIYIAFTTMLSGFLFARKSTGGLAAASILAATILMVAGLSWMDPEITPLVPVLKSYWLTIHVSMEAGSYGFLTLGALIGILNLSLMALVNVKNIQAINRTIQELTITSEMILIAGVFIISIGTYLGGVWANESWGRYWGWDAKETWALVTILVYAFILHMRFIPGLRGNFAFNLASLFGFASVMMTYFGVNYYLSGLHSYASGDPVPIPDFIYYIVVSLVVLSVLAFYKYKKILAQV